jgi:AraC-like DNA-binding protein
MRYKLARLVKGWLDATVRTIDELCRLIERYAESGELTSTRTAIPILKITRCRITTEPIGHVYEPLLAVVGQGEKRTVLGDHTFNYGAGQYLAVSVDLPITSHIVSASNEKPFLAVGLTLTPSRIAALLLEAAVNDGLPPDLAGMGVSTLSPELLDAIVRLVELLNEPRDIPVLLPGIEREILWRLLNGEKGALVRQIGLADSRLSQISHAIRWIRSHYAHVMRIEDLAERASMSLSTFHRHFRAVTAMTPIQYQKQVRLQEARAKLLTASYDVASVGFSVGYDSPSQFSREYCRLFGAPPGRDAARLKTMAPLVRSAV